MEGIGFLVVVVDSVVEVVDELAVAWVVVADSDVEVVAPVDEVEVDADVGVFLVVVRGGPGARTVVADPRVEGIASSDVDGMLSGRPSPSGWSSSTRSDGSFAATGLPVAIDSSEEPRVGDGTSRTVATTVPPTSAASDDAEPARPKPMVAPPTETTDATVTAAFTHPAARPTLAPVGPATTAEVAAAPEEMAAPARTPAPVPNAAVVSLVCSAGSPSLLVPSPELDGIESLTAEPPRVTAVPCRSASCAGGRGRSDTVDLSD